LYAFILLCQLGPGLGFTIPVLVVFFFTIAPDRVKIVENIGSLPTNNNSSRSNLVLVSIIYR